MTPTVVIPIFPPPIFCGLKDGCPWTGVVKGLTGTTSPLLPLIEDGARTKRSKIGKTIKGLKLGKDTVISFQKKL